METVDIQMYRGHQLWISPIVDKALDFSSYNVQAATVRRYLIETTRLNVLMSCKYNEHDMRKISINTYTNDIN